MKNAFLRSMARAITVCGLCLIPLSVHADDDNDFRIRYGEQFLRTISLSPRATGLGGTYAAINDGANSTFENPAALGSMMGREVVTNTGLDFIREGGDSATFVNCTVGGAFNLNASAPQYHPVDQMGNHTLGIAYHRSDGWVDDSDGLGRESNAITLAYGRSIMMGRILIGGSVSYEDAGVNDNAGLDLEYYRLGIKGGMILRVNEQFNIGGLVSYAGGPGEQNAAQGTIESYVEHFELRTGMAYQYTEDLLFAADMSFENLKQGQDDGMRREEEHSIFQLSAGTEFAIIPQELLLRGGLYYKQDSWRQKGLPGYEDEDESEGGLALGANYYRDNWSLEYDLQLQTTGDHSHFFSFVLDF